MPDNTTASELAQATFQRCPKDPENPYSQISNALIRDITLSPECRWLLIYLLSNRDGWKINTSQIITHVKGLMGRDKVYKVVNEAIDAGYMMREVVKKGNLIRYVLYISESPKFKKSFRFPGFQDPEDPHYKKTIDKKTIPKSISNKNTVSEPSVRLTDFFLLKLKEINPKILNPNLDTWEKEMRRLLHTDCRSEEEIEKVINFIVRQHHNPTRDFTWSKAVMSPRKLREHFAAIWLEMNKPSMKQEKKESGDVILKRIQSNLKISKEIATDFENIPGLRIFVSDNCIQIRKGNVTTTIPYTENGFKDQTFNALRRMNIQIPNKE